MALMPSHSWILLGAGYSAIQDGVGSVGCRIACPLAGSTISRAAGVEAMTKRRSVLLAITTRWKPQTTWNTGT